MSTTTQQSADPFVNASRHLAQLVRERQPRRGPESVAQQIERTGLHPITQGAPRRPGRHAAPWTPARAYEDAHQALECYQPTGRRRATEYIGTAYPLQPHEAEAAVWTKGALQ